MVGKIEEFGAELKVSALGSAKFLEEGEIEAMEAWPAELAWPPAQGAVVGLADGSRHRWSRECRSI